MKWVRERRENENFMKRAGEAAGESGNFHETNVGLLAKVKIFLRRVGAC